MRDEKKLMDDLLRLLANTTSQSPMTNMQIEVELCIVPKLANELLDKLYEGKAIGSVKNIKGGVEQRLVWVTGLPYRPAPSMPKDIAWQHLRTQSPKDQPAPPKQETTMDDQPKTVLIVPTNLNEKGIKTPQKIVRFLFANTKVTSNEIREHCNLKDIDPFIKAYVRKGYINRDKNEAKLVVYSISPKGRLLGSADALYEHARVKTPSQLVVDDKKPSMDDRVAIDHVFDKLIAEEKAENQPAPAPITQEDDRVRFAFTSDGTVLIMGIQFEPIELTKPQTNRLIKFIENTAGMQI